jgi:serine/threonine-protein kinase
MEYVEGQDLKKIIRSVGALGVDRALHLAIQICAGIGFAHRAGFVHADVKPQNILVTKDDIVKVTDFGIAQALTGDTQPGQKLDVVWGSPHYFAPEQAKGEKPTPASDVYAIGIVMFEMLTGRLPYMGANQQELAMAHIKERIPLASEFNPAVPETLARIVAKVMSKEPAARYRMADQLGHVLIGYRDQGRQQTTAAPLVSPTPPPPLGTTPGAPTMPGTQAVPSSPQPSSQPVQPLQVRVPGSQPAQHPPILSEPTERYSAAPSAPSFPPTSRPQSPSTLPSSGASVPLPPYQAPSIQSGNSGRYYSQQYERGDEEAPSSLDVVTIALAVLAFFAVACLIPLYIAVFQARGGG